ncbi:uncharacterized protein LOC135383167 [Ornithodoros turicata]|uniref:uncharacterized protein LOC135383167 n=1 Tax=Ornithodoros turicata TaxID=34597 RepID=UPI00313A258C
MKNRFPGLRAGSIARCSPPEKGEIGVPLLGDAAAPGSRCLRFKRHACELARMAQCRYSAPYLVTQLLRVQRGDVTVIVILGLILARAIDSVFKPAVNECLLTAAATPVSGNIPCEIVLIFGGRCLEYTRLKYRGSLLSCSYMCAPSKRASCYQVEEEELPCLRFDPPSYGKCFAGVCYTWSEFQNVTKGKNLKRTLDCAAGHDYLYNSYGPFGCKYYWSEGASPANRPDGTGCLNRHASPVRRGSRRYTADVTCVACGESRSPTDDATGFAEGNM